MTTSRIPDRQATKSGIPCPNFGKSRFPDCSQTPNPVKIFRVFPNPAPYLVKSRTTPRIPFLLFKLALRLSVRSYSEDRTQTCQIDFPNLPQSLLNAVCLKAQFLARLYFYSKLMIYRSALIFPILECMLTLPALLTQVRVYKQY